MATTSHVSRRSLFTAAAATLAGTAVAALPMVGKADPHADAELVRLWAEYVPLSRYINTRPQSLGRDGERAVREGCRS